MPATDTVNAPSVPAARKAVRAPELLRAEAFRFEYRQRTSPETSGLDLLSYGTYRIAPGAASDELFHRAEEALLFCLEGEVEIQVWEGPPGPDSASPVGSRSSLPQTFSLSHYDTLYVPLAIPYRIRNRSAREGLLAVCRAPAANRHAPHHASWERVRRDEGRIRRLNGKDVYMMFDVGERADRLVAGYTIYRPHVRAWPPHNHSDQEEIYLFTKGRGASEVYADEESKTFVHAVGPLDAVTIPLWNYHPVFSHDEELQFIWCLSGERYWVGDKHKEFMNATVDRLTT